MSIPVRPVGSQGLKCSMQGYGCMNLSAMYGAAMPDEDALKVLERALELGITHFDTAESYCGKNLAGEDKHNEVLVGAFLQKVGRDKLTFATKYFPVAKPKSKAACTEEAVRASLQASLDRLKQPNVDLYYLHRIPSMEALKSWMHAAKKLVEEGKIKYLGLSEATPAEIEVAHAIHPLTAVQQEWNVIVRNVERDLLPTCKKLGIAIVAYSPLARGLTSGLVKKDEDWSKILKSGNDLRETTPFLRGDALSANVKFLEALEDEAQQLGVAPAQLSLAWLHAHGGDIVFPIPGTTSLSNLETNVGAVQLSMKLGADVVQKIGKYGSDRGLKIEGARFSPGLDAMSYEKRLKE